MIFNNNHMRNRFRAGYFMIWVVNNEMGYFEMIKMLIF